MATYNDYIYEQTKKYQKKYAFEVGTGKHDTWNNESDAFKHTFMSVDLALRYNVGLSKYAGDKHEEDGNKNMGQSKGEDNMDRWNNQQGRQIAQKIMNEIKNPLVLKSYLLSGKLEDRIAGEVMHKMKKGDLITKTSDTRKYVEPKTPSQKFDDEIRAKVHEMRAAQSEKLKKIFGKSKSSKSSGSGNGRWITMNGGHVFIED